MSIPFVLIVVMAAVFGPVCSWLALRRARSWAVWFIFGVLLGPIAVGLLLAAPPGRCPSWGAPTRGGARRGGGWGGVLGETAPVPEEPAPAPEDAAPAPAEPAPEESAPAPGGEEAPVP